ncbi:MAG TPA: P-loop NTPase fold protein, partial [Thermoanaerobaculia bacterium]|nr:P-loop NTPase fold protein [Thermoanaerobaculia bacterium]
MRLAALPNLSKHVRQAFQIAAATAQANGESRIRGRHLFYGMLSVKVCSVAKALATLKITPADVQLKDKTRITGYASDVSDGTDRLGIEREARVFAAVLGASKVEPPIAVGLLGTWGSGKSFFMHELKRQFVNVESRGRSGDEESCSNIVQIWFNAWHYIDSNLWASLTSTIFDALDEELTIRAGALTDAESSADKKATLEADKARLQSEREAAGRDRSAAEAELQAIADTRHDLEDDDEVARRAGVSRIGSAAVEAVGKNPEVQQIAAEATNAAAKFAKDYGLDRETVESMRGTAGKLYGLFQVVRKKRGLWTWLLLGGIVLGSLALALIPQLKQLIRYTGSISLVGAAGSVVWLLALVKKYLPAVNEVVKRVDAFFLAKDELVGKLRKDQLKDLDMRGKEATERLSQAKAREQEAEKELRLKERDLMELRPMQQMKSFVRERRDSTDYTQHLGVIAHAHEDFDRLSRHLATVRKQ